MLYWIYSRRPQLKQASRLLRVRWIVSALLLMIFSVSTVGCSIGVKEKIRVIYVQHSKLPEETQGALRIATNDKIPITVVGKTDVSTELNVGGYFVISAGDLKAFIQAVRDLDKIKKTP